MKNRVIFVTILKSIFNVPTAWFCQGCIGLTVNCQQKQCCTQDSFHNWLWFLDNFLICLDINSCFTVFIGATRNFFKKQGCTDILPFLLRG